MNATQLSKDLPESATWLNAPPATLMHFQGRPLVLAFVNAASARCSQRLQELQQWQVRHPGRLQLVVVQVPRFEFERDGQRSLAMLARYGIQAPVMLDLDWQAWRRFQVESWPTLVMIDAASREVDRLVGLGQPLDPVLSQLSEGVKPVPVNPMMQQLLGGAPQDRELRYPMGLQVTRDRLYIADSGRHRVLECNHQGRILRQFGMGTADWADGSSDVAAFNRPRSLALGHGHLYVADAGNHCIRRINLLGGQVDTLIGNGRAGDPREQVLAQPGDSALQYPAAIALLDNQLVIAMTGDNRIWSYDLGTRQLAWRAGSGAMELRDGSGQMAAFAQPVSLTVANKTLYVCDALSSAVRSMQLRGELVQTVAGQGMWQHGLSDGNRSQALLQYPLALAADQDAQMLWVADAGNGKLRRIRLASGQVSTAELGRPLHGTAGLAVESGVVWIADTEACAVLRYDPHTGQCADVPIG